MGRREAGELECALLPPFRVSLRIELRVRGSTGRSYCGTKIAAGKTYKEGMRSLKRRLAMSRALLGAHGLGGARGLRRSAASWRVEILYGLAAGWRPGHGAEFS